MATNPFTADESAPVTEGDDRATAPDQDAGCETGQDTTLPRGVTLLAAAVAALVVVPVVWIGFVALSVDVERALSIVVRPATFDVLVNTLVLIGLVTTFSVLLGVPLAVLTVLTDLPYSRFWMATLALPLVVPSYTSAYAFISVWGPNGLLQSLLAPLGVSSLPELYGMPGTVFILTLYNYPFVYITTVAGLRAFDKTYIDAARTLEDDLIGVFREVVLPMTKPAIAAGALLAALETAGDFGVPAMLRLDVFTRQIYVEHNALAHDYAAMLSVHLVAITLVILAIEYYVREHRTVHGGSRGVSRSYTLRLGRWKWPALAGCGLVVTLAIVLPVSFLLWWLARGPETYVGAFGFRPEYALNSVSVSALAALVAVVLALPVAYLSARHRSVTSTIIERATYIGFAVPGVVIGLSLVYFGSAYAPALYQTIPLLVFAYVVLYLPLAVGAARTAFLYVNPRFVEAARSLGCPPRTAFRRVTLPLVIPGIVAGGALVFLHGMKELPATLLLRPAGFESLATFIWMAERNAYYGYAAVPALVLVCVSAVAILGVLPTDRVNYWSFFRRSSGDDGDEDEGEGEDSADGEDGGYTTEGDDSADSTDTDEHSIIRRPTESGSSAKSATDGGRRVHPNEPTDAQSRSRTTTDAVLELDGVTKAYDGRPAVDELSLSVREGELLTLLGPSGCGKTTTLRLIAGLTRPDDGSITLRGQSIADGTTFVPSEERDVGIVFQDFALFPHKTVAANVAFGLHEDATDTAADDTPDHEAIVDDLLELVGLSDYRTRYPDELSGGQKQRIALARSLAPEPDVLLLDEPLSNLDTGLRVRMRETIADILDRVDVTAVWVTHNQTEALSVGDRTAVMNAGSIEQIETPRELFMQPASRMVADFLGQASYLVGRPVDGNGVVETPIGALDRDRVSVRPGAPSGESGEDSGAGSGADLGQLNSGGHRRGPLDLLLRPDDVTIDPASTETADGRIVQRQFNGPTVRYRIELDAETGGDTSKGDGDAGTADGNGASSDDGAGDSNTTDSNTTDSNGAETDGGVNNVIETRCSHEEWLEVGTPVAVTITATHDVPAFESSAGWRSGEAGNGDEDGNET